MVKTSALLYVFLAVVCVVLTVINAYKSKQTWGELLLMVALSLIPILNVIVAFVLIEDVVMKSRILKKRVS